MANNSRGGNGKYRKYALGTKKTRAISQTDEAWLGLKLLAEHRNIDSRAEYLERLVREECDRLGIPLESSEEAA